MSALEDKAWAILKAHVGPANPIKSSELAVALGMGDEHRGTRGTRALIQDLVRRGLPVGATENGYFLLENQLQLERYVTDLMDRAGAIQYRASTVKRAFEQYYQGEAQQTLYHWAPDPEEIA